MEMNLMVFIRLVIGLIALTALTLMYVTYGWGGFFLVWGIILVVIFAFNPDYFN